MDRLFLRHPGEPVVEEPNVFVGALPPDWDIPLPVGAVVVGAYVSNRFHTRVALDMSGDHEQAAARVDQMLKDAGWTSQERTPPAIGGFIPARDMIAGPARRLQDAQRRRTLFLTSGPIEGGLASIVLDLDANPDNFRVFDDIRRRRRPSSILPPLTPPPAMTMRRGGGGGGSIHTASSHATLHGDLSGAAIEAHYRGQLAAAGWRQGESHAAARWTWSTWDFTDEYGEPWTALLSVAEAPAQAAVRSVFLDATKGEAAQGGPFPTLSTAKESAILERRP
jgi:hypothetical protein